MLSTFGCRDGFPCNFNHSTADDCRHSLQDDMSTLRQDESEGPGTSLASYFTFSLSLHFITVDIYACTFLFPSSIFVVDHRFLLLLSNICLLQLPTSSLTIISKRVFVENTHQYSSIKIFCQNAFQVECWKWPRPTPLHRQELWCQANNRPLEWCCGNSRPWNQCKCLPVRTAKSCSSIFLTTRWLDQSIFNIFGSNATLANAAFYQTEIQQAQARGWRNPFQEHSC